MSGLREPGLGPIVGHTTSNSCRVWIRADDPADEGAKLDAERRTIGVVAVVARAGVNIPKDEIHVHYFRLRREFDRTGTFNIGVDTGVSDGKPALALDDDTEYEVRLGTLTVDDPYRNDENIGNDTLANVLPDPSVWLDALLALDDKRSSAKFRTFPAPGLQQLSFILGSCRYPGLLWKIKLADKIFGPIRTETMSTKEGGLPRFTLMVGDQIYADKFNRLIPIGLADTYEEFQERYITAFSSGNMRKLLKSIPSYMILDDHEIEDNWSQDRLKDSSKGRLFNLAIGAYMSYQWSHGPRNFDNCLYYNFDCGGIPFFVLDTRTQRYMDDAPDDLSDNHLLGRPSLHPDEPNQLDILIRWLKRCQDSVGSSPKFIVSSSVFVPNPMSTIGRVPVSKIEDCDSWPAFPQTRRAILQEIVKNKIQNVVFLSGDIHNSNVAEMRFSNPAGDMGIKAFSITSSALYWPFPFANGAPSDYVHDSTAANQKDTFVVDAAQNITMDYKAWNFTQADNFCRIDLDLTQKLLIVRAFDDEGSIVRNKKLDGTSYPLEQRFNLA